MGNIPVIVKYAVIVIRFGLISQIAKLMSEGERQGVVMGFFH